jgi:hypothetical protein
MPFRNCPHLPTTQCACAEIEDFAKQRNGGSGREKDLSEQDVWKRVNIMARYEQMASTCSRHLVCYDVS